MASNPQYNGKNGTGTVSKSYAAAQTSAVDLVTERPGFSLTGDSAQILPRQIVVHGAGDLEVAYRNGQTDTIAALSGMTYNISPSTLGGSSTTATNVTVIW